MADRTDKPKYTVDQLAALLRRSLVGYIPQSRIPSRAELARYFGASEHAVRKACRILIREGLLLARHRGGLFVQPAAAQQKIRRVHALVRDRPAPLFQQTVLLGVDQRCAQLRLPLRVTRVADRPDWEHLLSRLAEGLAEETGWVLLTPDPPQHTLLAWQIESIPYVLLDMYPEAIQVNVVARDLTGAILRATEHLIELGHRRIAFADMVSTGRDVPQVRREAYRLVMAKHGMPLDDSLLISDSGRPGSTQQILTSMLRVQAGSPPFTGLVAADQRIGCEALHACEAGGLDVPADLSVVSAGVSLHTDAPELARLSCFDEGPAERLGQLAVDVLMESTRHREPVAVHVGHRWVDRGSTAPPRA